MITKRELGISVLRGLVLAAIVALGAHAVMATTGSPPHAVVSNFNPQSPKPKSCIPIRYDVTYSDPNVIDNLCPLPGMPPGMWQDLINGTVPASDG